MSNCTMSSPGPAWFSASQVRLCRLSLEETLVRYRTSSNVESQMISCSKHKEQRRLMQPGHSYVWITQRHTAGIPFTFLWINRLKSPTELLYMALYKAHMGRPLSRPVGLDLDRRDLRPVTLRFRGRSSQIY